MLTHGEESLRLFVENLNSYQTTIKIYSDLVVGRNDIFGYTGRVKNGRLETDLHVKPTDTHQYLQVDSFSFQTL